MNHEWPTRLSAVWPFAAAQCSHHELPRHSRSARKFAARHDVSSGQARGRAIRRRRDQHPLPGVQQADGHGCRSRSARRSAPRSTCGNSATCRPWRPSSIRRASTTLAYLPRSAHVTGDMQIHEMAYVGDDALVRQHSFLLPRDARSRPQLRPRLAAEVHLATHARRPLPSQRHGA